MISIVHMHPPELMYHIDELSLSQNSDIQVAMNDNWYCSNLEVLSRHT